MGNALVRTLPTNLTQIQFCQRCADAKLFFRRHDAILQTDISFLVRSHSTTNLTPKSNFASNAYIQIWFKNAAGYIEDDSVSAEGLIGEIENKPQIAGLAQNPLLLSLLCSLYQTKGLTRRGMGFG